LEPRITAALLLTKVAIIFRQTATNHSNDYGCSRLQLCLYFL